jgi:anionic cell wall polymer biosynthesis LytR-Cps2A-Psr (LCP) family protein
MMSFKDKLVKNPMMLGKVADQMTKVMGEALTVPEMVALARFAQSTGNDNIKMGQIPVTELEHYDLAVDEDKLPDVLARFNFARDDLGSTNALRSIPPTPRKRIVPPGAVPSTSRGETFASR